MENLAFQYVPLSVILELLWCLIGAIILVFKV